MSGGPRATYRRRHRVRLSREFAAVYGSRLKKNAGPLMVFASPNGLAEHRLGLAVGRRFGGAVQRVRMKRLLREAFRLTRMTLPMAEPGGAYDIVVRVQAHTPVPLARYRAWLCDAMARIDRVHQKRAERGTGVDRPGDEA